MKMKKQLLKLSLTLMALLMGGVGSAFAENTLIWSLNFTEKAPATKVITNLTEKGDYQKVGQKVGQDEWKYVSKYVTEFDNIAFTRLRSDKKQYGFALRTNGSDKGLYCQGQPHTMTLVNMKQNYIITVKTSANAITEQYKGNYGADASIQTSDNNTTYTYKMLGDGDLNLLVAKDAYVKSIKVEKPDETAVELKYTVNAVCNGKTIKTFESGTAFSTDNKMVFYPICLNVDNTWYVTAEKQYGILIDSNIEKDIEYTVNKNIVAFAEAESSTNASSDNINYSSGKSGYVKTQRSSNQGISMGTLAPGKYKMVVSVLNNAFRGVALRNQKSKDSNVNIIAQTDLKSTGLQIVEFVLKESLPLIVNGKNADKGWSNQSADFDYIYIQRTGDATETATISDAGYATYATTHNVVVPNNENVKVMTVKVIAEGKAIELHEVAAGTVIPAKTGILVKAPTGNCDFVVTSKEGTPLENNNLIAATEPVKSDGATFFALTKMDTKVGFAVVKEGVNIPAGKAYLKVPAASTAKFFGLDGEATGINSVKTAKADGAYYTLEGVKTTKPVKGLYIHNGKKIVVK